MTVCYNNYFIVSLDITSILKETLHDDQLWYLFGISDKWYDIGISLQVCRNVLDDLKANEDDNIIKLMKVINIWKDTKSSPVTWETVITAIENSNVNNKELTELIHQYIVLSKLLLLCNDVVLLILSLSINCIVQTF